MTHYHLGCGSQYLSGYINIDFPEANHNVNHDVKADLYTDILEMKYEECDEIRSHHFFEHHNYYDSFVLLFKWTEALKVGAKLIIDVPDLEALCKAYLAADVKKKFLVVRYISGSHEGSWAVHFSNWNEDTLSYVLKEIGYLIEKVDKYGSPTEEKPNCGVMITAKKETVYSREELIKKLENILELYQNGKDSDFENRLGQYFKDEMKKKI